MRVMKLAVVAAALVTGTVFAQAQSSNLVENIQINLVGLRQGPTVTTRGQVVTSVDTLNVGTRQVIVALGAATGNTFPNNSRLVLVTALDGNSSSVEVRTGGAKVDVTGFFVLERTGTAVTSSVLNTRNGRSTQLIYSVQRFAVVDQEGSPALNVHLDVSGLGRDFSANYSVPGPDNRLTIDATGNGDRNGVPLVLQGTVTISGQTLEPGVDAGPS